MPCTYLQLWLSYKFSFPEPGIRRPPSRRSELQVGCLGINFPDTSRIIGFVLEENSCRNNICQIENVFVENWFFAAIMAAIREYFE
jgi:hypothetical protein